MIEIAPEVFAAFAVTTGPQRIAEVQAFAAGGGETGRLRRASGAHAALAEMHRAGAAQVPDPVPFGSALARRACNGYGKLPASWLQGTWQPIERENVVYHLGDLEVAAPADFGLLVEGRSYLVKLCTGQRRVTSRFYRAALAEMIRGAYGERMAGTTLVIVDPAAGRLHPVVGPRDPRAQTWLQSEALAFLDLLHHAT